MLFHLASGRKAGFQREAPSPLQDVTKHEKTRSRMCWSESQLAPRMRRGARPAQGTEPARAGQLSPATTRAAPGPSLAGMPRGQCASRAARPRVPQGDYYCLLRTQAPVSGGRGTRPGDQAADAASALGGPCPAGAQMGLGRGRGSLCGRPTTQSAGTGGPSARDGATGRSRWRVASTDGSGGKATGQEPRPAAPPTTAPRQAPGPVPPASARLLVLGGLNRPPCGTRPVPGAGPLAPAAGLSGSRLGDEGPAGRPSPALLRHAPAARLRPQRGGQRGARRGRTGVPPRARSVCGLRRRRCLYDGDRDPSRG